MIALNSVSPSTPQSTSKRLNSNQSSQCPWSLRRRFLKFLCGKSFHPVEGGCGQQLQSKKSIMKHNMCCCTAVVTQRLVADSVATLRDPLHAGETLAGRLRWLFSQARRERRLLHTWMTPRSSMLACRVFPT